MTLPTDASIQADVQHDLDQGTAPGQTSWASTEKAILGTEQTLVNLINDFRKDVDAQLAALQTAVANIQTGGGSAAPTAFTGTVTLKASA